MGHLRLERPDRQAPLIIPLSFSVVALCSVIFTGTELYSTLLFLVPSLSVLAALGVVSLKRSRENFLDLYSGIIYTLAVIAVWIYFFAWTEGVPAKMAFSLTRLAPEVEPHGTSVFLFFLAVTATVLWIAIVFWRLFNTRFLLERRMDGRNRPDCGMDHRHELIRQLD